MCKCFLIEELSLNILVQPLCGQGTVRGMSSQGLCCRILNTQTTERTAVLLVQNIDTE